MAIAIAALVASGLLLANLAGNPVENPAILANDKYGPHFNCSMESVVHGWPFSYLRHAGQAGAANRLSAWRVGGGVHFTTTAFVANLAAAAAGTAGAYWVVRRRIQAFGWRFRLVDLLATFAFLSIVLALAASRLHVHQSQVAYLQRYNQSVEFAEWEPFGPHWLRSKTGSQYWEWGDRLIGVDCLLPDDLKDLPGKSAVKVLRVFALEPDKMHCLAEFDNLLALDLCFVSYDRSDRADNRRGALWRCLQAVAQIDSLQGLNLYDARVTNRDLQELARMPNLIHLDISGNPDVTDDGLRHLASIQTLRKLSLDGTSVTKDGLAQLQSALPNCEILAGTPVP
jgi:hypothetical protein